MSTPLQVRERRREAQRTVRLALNDLNRGLDEWKEGINEGKACALELTNEILTSRHVAQIPLAGLHVIPGLRARALVKCAQQINWYVAELEQSVERLERGLDLIRHAAQSIATLNNKEEGESRMLGRPVFRDLSIDVIARMFAQIAESYDAELTVKRCVVSDFKGKSEEAIEVIKKLTVSMDDWTGNTESSTVQEERTTESTESYLQVHITAWMLNTEVDDDLVTQSLEMMTQDAKSC